ncbi:GGDEF domain-containing protein, partial [Acidocella sp.]
LLLALAYLTAAAGLGNPRARRFSALIIILLSLLTLAASFLMGAQAGGALFYVIYQGMGLAMVCTAIVFGQTERAALVWLIALSTALLAVCVAVSPLPGMAAKAQFAVYYGLFMAGLGLAKTLQDRTAERLFLLQLRDELAADEMAARNDQLASMACTDPLTGLANRRAFDEVMAALETDSSWALPLALCMLDLDHFKPFNDRLGHLAGDDCLRQAAGAMRAQLRRQTDVLARYGGEEFVLILPNTSHAEAQDIAARVRAAVFALGRSHPASPFGRVTVSAGLAVAGSAERVRGLVAQADGALYRAKQAGRNQVAL